MVKKVIEKLGIDPNQFIMVDGSGLSRYNYVSTDLITDLLASIYKDEIFDIYYDAFPYVELDERYSKLIKENNIEGRIKAKTGSISNSRALSGYAKTSDGGF